MVVLCKVISECNLFDNNLGENGSLLRSSNTMEDGLESFDTDVIGDGVEVVINELGQIHQNDSKRQRLDDLSEDTGCTVDNLGLLIL